jgi:hypothetical protein
MGRMRIPTKHTLQKMITIRVGNMTLKARPVAPKVVAAANKRIQKKVAPVIAQSRKRHYYGKIAI